MYPDFLVIGAQKAGTTWLDRNLRDHPQVWLPPEKEIHYFDLPPLLPFAALIGAPVRAARYWIRARLKRDWVKVKEGSQSFKWYIQYYFFPRTNFWYRSLFEPSPRQICGEATPRYATLNEKKIYRIKQMMPNLKLIYLLRDPLDRMWSDMAMFQRPRFGGQGINKSNQETIRNFLANPHNLAHSRYDQNISIWLKYFKADQMFIGFQEEIRESPQELLIRLAKFLSIDPEGFGTFQNAEERINSKNYRKMGKHIERYLADELARDVANLDRRLGSPFTKAWKTRIESCQKNSSKKTL
jgi:hypothetical protein